MQLQAHSARPTTSSAIGSRELSKDSQIRASLRHHRSVQQLVRDHLQNGKSNESEFKTAQRTMVAQTATQKLARAVAPQPLHPARHWRACFGLTFPARSPDAPHVSSPSSPPSRRPASHRHRPARDLAAAELRYYFPLPDFPPPLRHRFPPPAERSHLSRSLPFLGQPANNGQRSETASNGGSPP